MNNENLKQRTKLFALEVVKLVEALPPGKTGDVLGRQLLRSGTSVGANYRAACRAKSPADFIFKLGIVEEEADESSFWIDLLVEAGKLNGNKVAPLLKECNELVAITVASIRTAKKTRELDHSAPRPPHSELPSPRSALRTPNSALPPPHSALRTPR
jgi:four helix bundle protein